MLTKFQPEPRRLNTTGSIEEVSQEGFTGVTEVWGVWLLFFCFGLGLLCLVGCCFALCFVVLLFCCCFVSFFKRAVITLLNAKSVFCDVS